MNPAPLRTAFLGLMLVPYFAGAPRASGEVIVLKGISVVDVERGVVRPDQSIVIDGEKIARVGPAGEVTAPDGARAIDGKGLFAIPGLFDAHVHYISPDTFGPLCIAHGVTFVRDMGGSTETILSVRDQLNRGEMLGPEMIATGAIIDGVPPVWPFSEPCDEPGEARAAVKKLADRGVNQIKVYSKLKKDVYLAAVEAAHARGLKAVGHVPLTVSLSEAIEAGQDGIEHLEGFDELIAGAAGKPAAEPRSFRDVFDRWALYPEADKAKLRQAYEGAIQRGVTICPTMVVYKGIGAAADPDFKNPWLEYVPPFMVGFWNSGRTRHMASGAARTVPLMQQVVAELHKAGATLICGTDLANPNVIAGHSLLEEMELFQEAGVPAADVLRSATVKPATFFGVADRLGTIAEGKTASMLLLHANPLEDIGNVRKIEAVLLRGRPFDHKALDELLAGVRRSIAGSAPATQPALAADEPPPGEIIRKGRYRSKFQGMAAGFEDFVLSRTPSGYYLKTVTHPMGGPQPPSAITVETDDSFNLTRATWRTLTESPIDATYTREGNTVRAEARQGETKHAPQELTLPADWLFGAPATAVYWVEYKRVELNVGESKVYHSVSFGFPSWQLGVTEVKTERLPDETLPVAAGKEGSARVYASKFETPVGSFAGKLWLDADGVVVKSTLTMPFGSIDIVLEPAGAPTP